jgi:hypothetical protein
LVGVITMNETRGGEEKFWKEVKVEEKWAGPVSDVLEGVESDLWDLEVKNWRKKTNNNRGTDICRKGGKGS